MRAWATGTATLQRQRRRRRRQGVDLGAAPPSLVPGLQIGVGEDRRAGHVQQARLEQLGDEDGRAVWPARVWVLCSSQRGCREQAERREQQPLVGGAHGASPVEEPTHGSCRATARSSNAAGERLRCGVKPVHCAARPHAHRRRRRRPCAGPACRACKADGRTPDSMHLRFLCSSMRKDADPAHFVVSTAGSCRSLELVAVHPRRQQDTGQRSSKTTAGGAAGMIQKAAQSWEKEKHCWEAFSCLGSLDAIELAGLGGNRSCGNCGNSLRRADPGPTAQHRLVWPL